MALDPKIEEIFDYIQDINYTEEVVIIKDENGKQINPEVKFHNQYRVGTFHDSKSKKKYEFRVESPDIVKNNCFCRDCKFRPAETERLASKDKKFIGFFCSKFQDICLRLWIDNIEEDRGEMFPCYIKEVTDESIDELDNLLSMGEVEDEDEE